MRDLQPPPEIQNVSDEEASVSPIYEDDMSFVEIGFIYLLGKKGVKLDNQMECHIFFCTR